MATINYRATSLKFSSSTTTIVNKPTGTIEGDIMIAIVRTSAGGAGYPASILPSGWSSYFMYTDFGGLELCYKVAGASEPTTYTWTFPTTVSVSTAISSYYGDFDKNTPINTVSNTLYNTSNTTNRAISMTTTLTNCPLIFIGYVETNVGSTKPSVPTTGWVENFDAVITGTPNRVEFCSMIWTSSGATGNIDATLSSSQTSKGAFALALNPPIIANTNNFFQFF